MRRIFAAVAAAVLTFVLSAACASTAGYLTGASPQDVPAKAAAKLAELDERINGSLESRSAGQFRTYMAFQVPVRECMAKHGFSYTPPPWVDPHASQPAIRPFSYIDVLMPVDEQQIARGLYLAEDYRSLALPANPGFTSLDAEGQKRYGQQLTVCEPAQGSYDRSYPRGALQLSWKLEETLAKPLAASPELRAMATTGYRACMTEAGYPVKDRIALTEHLRGKHFTTAVSDAERRAARDAEVVAARADAVCRKDSHPLAMSLIASALADFETGQAEKIADIEVQWAKFRDDAKRAQAQMTW